MLSVLLIDNFDSFSFNLVDELERRGAAVSSWRNDLSVEAALDLARRLAPPRLIVISPGPGTPEQAGCSMGLARAAAEEQIPVFGVCLGHQAIVTAFGGEVGFAGEVVHGKAATIVHSGCGPLRELPSPMRAARYHSLAATRVPEDLEATAFAGEIVMAVAHRRLPAFGVQFHPESILTTEGGRLIEGVMAWASEEKVS